MVDFWFVKPSSLDKAKELMKLLMDTGIDIDLVLDSFQALINSVKRKPEQFESLAHSFTTEVQAILMGESSISPDKRDDRFQHPGWQEQALYKVLMQFYLLTTRTAHTVVEQADLKPLEKKRIHFFIGLITEAIAPCNTLYGNPEAVERALVTHGESLKNGLKHWMEDFVHNDRMPSQVDKSKFKLGINLALSEGQVIYREELFELIQYKPKTAEVFERPLLLIPPQINKFYLFDIAPGKSLIEYLINRKQQVFVISWRNPKPEHAEWSLEDYVVASERALKKVLQLTNSEKANVMAACMGGYTGAFLQGYLQQTQQDLIASMSYLVTILDTSWKTTLNMLTSERAIKRYIEQQKEKKLIDGKSLAKLFAWLRPNDLIWRYYRNNYLLGKRPPAFDILYWNADTTRLPAKLHTDILSALSENILATREGIPFQGGHFRLQDIKTDSFFIAGKTDHITPWKACYRSMQLLGGQKEFLLTSLGHVQSVTCSPQNRKAVFWKQPKLFAEPEAWYEQSEECKGSWWAHWLEWLNERSGACISAKPILYRIGINGLASAPGQYVVES